MRPLQRNSGAVPFVPASDNITAFRQFSFSQEFPYPGKRGLQTSIATTDVEAGRWTYEATRRRLVADLKTAFGKVGKELGLISG